MDLDELMKMGLERAVAYIAEKPATEEVPPHFFGSDGMGKVGVYMTPWSDEADKILMVDKVRSMFLEHGVIRYVLVSEVWVVERSEENPPDDRMPSECPDRKERLSVMGVEYGGTKHVYCDIIRDGAKRHCGPPQWGVYDKATGRMTSLLPERKMAS